MILIQDTHFVGGGGNALQYEYGWNGFSDSPISREVYILYLQRDH